MPSPSHPHLHPTTHSQHLIVDSKPFLPLAAELHNSSLSSPSYMRTHVYAKTHAMNINTLLGAVTWEMVEPVEDCFDFSRLDEVIADARKWGIRLVVLWFGGYKNGMSTYVPGWVKRDMHRFERVRVGGEGNGKERVVEVLSPFCEENWRADGKAFKALMKHLRELDGEVGTVVMVQVENEVGLLGDSRDRSPLAEEEWKKGVPGGLLQDLCKRKEEARLHPMFKPKFLGFAEGLGWETVFGDKIRAEEAFMAHTFSSYVGRVAAAGKAEYPLPLYTNTWMNLDTSNSPQSSSSKAPTVAGGGDKPGVYPSGGPVAHVLDIWKVNAHALDFISPDCYLNDFETVCRHYSHDGQPLFIPEQRRDEFGARRVFLAYGSYGAIGCSPFGIDTLEAESSPWKRVYGLLGSVSRQILDAQANRPEDMMGFFFDEYEDGEEDKSWSRTFGDFTVNIERAFVFGRPGPGFGLIIHHGEGKFLVVGRGFQVSFASIDPKAVFTGILHAEEKVVGKDGELVTGRLMNGDETRSGAAFVMPNDEPDYGDFKIAISIPARTEIAEVQAYCLKDVE